MSAWVFVLATAGFVLFTDDYVIAGILPAIASDLNVSVSQAGQLVTVFSLTVAVAAPLLAVGLARSPRKRVLIAGLALFVVANAAAAVTTAFGVLLVLRVTAALSAAIATPALYAFVAQHAPAGKVGRYLAVVSIGVTGALAAGVPLGTWIGGTVGWNATFAVMSGAGAVVLVAAAVCVPADSGPVETLGFREQFRTLGNISVVLVLVAGCVLMSGTMMVYVYFAPYLAATATDSVAARTLAFSLAGIAGAVGVWLGGAATDRWGSARALNVGLGAIALSMAGLWILWLARPVPLAAVLTVGVVWAVFAFWNAPAIQARLFALAGPVAPQVLALNTSGNQVGAAIGGALGGAFLAALGIGAIPLLAAAIGVLALSIMGLTSRTCDAM